MSELVSHFASAVRRLREDRGWSQEHLAERSNLNRSYVGDLERGQSIPSLTTIGKLAEAFDLSPSLLVAQCEIRFASTNADLQSVA
ncbi:MAG TPA: helix-turn-helix transcriptional regulator [Rhodocyclaceae bacterium]|nr:helix-turn-helix transcriptional regulator [Rhodocyclaceae bacterium]